MKNGKIKLNKTKLIARVMLVVLLFAGALNLAGCGNKGLEAGFDTTGIGGCDDAPIFKCAYKSDVTEFDIENVTLRFYYGGFYELFETATEQYLSYPVFELYLFNDANPEDKILIKRVEENLISEKYRAYITTEKFKQIVKYNHSEDVTIPKEIFIDESGLIWFSVNGQNVLDSYSTDETLCIIGVYYSKIENKIILSTKEFD